MLYFKIDFDSQRGCKGGTENEHRCHTQLSLPYNSCVLLYDGLCHKWWVSIDTMWHTWFWFLCCSCISLMPLCSRAPSVRPRYLWSSWLCRLLLAMTVSQNFLVVVVVVVYNFDSFEGHGYLTSIQHPPCHSRYNPCTGHQQGHRRAK